MVGLSFLMTFLFNLSRGSLIIAILGHASFNTTSRWLEALLGHLSLREKLTPELVIGVCGLAVAIILVLFTRGRLARSGQERSQAA
jgi:ABC-type spermidine/putrescine transport system permease subunit II